MPSPTRIDLVGLPYPALVYLAARAAGRVATLLATWPEATLDHAQALRRAIDAAESVATTPPELQGGELVLDAREAAYAAADVAVAADAAGAPASALYAADAAAELAEAVHVERDRAVAERGLARVIEAALQALGAAPRPEGEPDPERYLEELRSDASVLRLHASTEGWTDAGPASKVFAVGV